jgi:retron-type reverse transcriptase
VVTAALEPAGDARFEPKSSGVRPGRRTWEASGAIEVQSTQQPTWVLEADIATGVDGLNQAAL